MPRPRSLKIEDKEKLIEHIRENIIGEKILIQTPFGQKPLVYADYVASGRSLKFVEDYLMLSVLPEYANTHTSTSYVGLQTTSLRTEAREIIKESLNCSEEDVVLFIGSGSTGAINKLVNVLKSSNWENTKNYFEEMIQKKELFSSRSANENENYTMNHINNFDNRELAKLKQKDHLDAPIVFVSIYEHHSNLLPWRESGADVEFIDVDDTGMLNLSSLEEKLIKSSSRKYKIGAFSAGSNVNGTLTDVQAVTRILKSHNALAFFDYAAAAPYVPINMNPSPDAKIDGLYFSGHKFIGGPGTPGILAVKRVLLFNKAPVEPGGGTVFSVNLKSQIYVADPEEKEEGGTPDIIGAIRLGLVFQLKMSIGCSYIYNTELDHYKRISKILNEIPNFVILGNLNAKRLPIFSFLIKKGSRYFHYSFICALLNDLFGIETRGGCACAGPYGMKLLKINQEKALEFERTRLKGNDLIKPGYTRLSFNYFTDEETIEYIISALKFVAMNAIWFLPQYVFTLNNNSCTHRDNLVNKPFKNPLNTLQEVNYKGGKFNYSHLPHQNSEDFNYYLNEANETLNEIKEHKYLDESDRDTFIFPKEIQHLRWFMLPSEAKIFIKTRFTSETKTKDYTLPPIHNQNYLSVPLQKGPNASSSNEPSSNGSSPSNSSSKGRSPKGVSSTGASPKGKSKNISHLPKIRSQKYFQYAKRSSNLNKQFMDVNNTRQRSGSFDVCRN